MTDQCSKIRPDYTTQNTESGVTLNVELPGVLKENTSISSEGNLLNISAKRENSIPEDWQLINQVKITEEYELALEIHKDLNLGEAKASFANGILKLEVPKHESKKPKQIEILD